MVWPIMLILLDKRKNTVSEEGENISLVYTLRNMNTLKGVQRLTPSEHPFGCRSASPIPWVNSWGFTLPTPCLHPFFKTVHPFDTLFYKRVWIDTCIFNKNIFDLSIIQVHIIFLHIAYSRCMLDFFLQNWEYSFVDKN